METIAHCGLADVPVEFVTYWQRKTCIEGSNDFLPASKSLLINNLYLCFACFPAIRGNFGEFAATTCSREFSSIDI